MEQSTTGDYSYSSQGLGHIAEDPGPGLENNMESDKITRLLRHLPTRRYFNGEGWTASDKQAALYNNQVSAVMDCVVHDLRDVELVLRVEDDTAFRARIR